MGDRSETLNQKQIEFIGKQQLFFVGTAATEGFVNISPKGMDTFRVISESKVVWLNLTGSGNETAAHLLESNRMTIMFCSFDRHPVILRLYGPANTIHPREKEWNELISQFPEYVGARQLFEMDIELVQSSCGYGVPYFEPAGERPTLTKYADKKGPDGIKAYWREKNMRSLNDKPTGIEVD
jgi:hypothetical protein